jgi:hypothetical protein
MTDEQIERLEELLKTALCAMEDFVTEYKEMRDKYEVKTPHNLQDPE